MDMLVKLYSLPDQIELIQRLADQRVVVRRAMAHEKHSILHWVEMQFGQATKGWQSECEIAFARVPIACQIATREDQILGFACHDVTAKNFFGPIGVAENWRANGIGTLLLLAALLCIREQGYAYAIIGHAGPGKFFKKAVGAVEIPGSTPGIYPTDSIS